MKISYELMVAVTLGNSQAIPLQLPHLLDRVFNTLCQVELSNAEAKVAKDENLYLSPSC